MIAVECFPDEAILRHVGVPGGRIVHAMGKGNVFNALAEGHVTTGMIDQDPGSIEPPQLRAFVASADCGSLLLMTHANQPSIRVIVIRPRLEEWLMRRAEANQIAPSDFGLPTTARELHKRKRYDRIPQFRDFVLALLAADAETKTLRRWVVES